MLSPLRCVALLLAAMPAPAMSVNFLSPPTNTSAAGGFVTTLSPLTPLSTGMDAAIVTLFQQDYPRFTYTNSTTAADGTLTIGSLVAFQNGLSGGLSISAAFSPAAGTHAPHLYEWMQYLSIDPLSTPFLGADASPFTDPPPDARDDFLPFYWTNLQRNTPGVGYVAGGTLNDDILFSDAPRVSDARAPVKVTLSLYLADFDSTSGSVTIYDGIQYGFDLSTPATVPEPPTAVCIAGIWMVLIIKISQSKRFTS
jgi:hypothetical protein